MLNKFKENSILYKIIKKECFMESARFSYKKSVLAILIMFFCIGLFGCTIENGLKSDDYGIFISLSLIHI